MNRMLRISSIWFCLLAFTGRALPAVDPAEFLKEIQPAVVTVVTYDSEKNILNKGSGFFINEQGDLITNFSILKGAHSAEIKNFKGNEYAIKMVLAQSPESGLVKVSVDIPEDTVKFVKLASAVPKVTEQVMTFDNSAKISSGIVIAVRDIPSTGNICQISAPIQADSIGAPVLNIRAEVIGMAAARSISS